MGFLETIGRGYQIMGQEAQQKIADNRANILTGVSVIGTIATAVVSWISGAKSARQIDAKSAELGRPLSTSEKAKLCWKNVILPAGTVIGSGAGAITSNRIQAGDIARLTTDVVIATKAYNEIKKASQEVMTEKQQNQMRENIANKEIEQAKEQPRVINSLPEPQNNARNQLFMDKFSGIVFWSTTDKVWLAINKLQEMMRELTPRPKPIYGCGRSRAEKGVHYREWLGLIGADMSAIGIYKKQISLHDHFGWNKGYWADGLDDDDCISCYMSPGEVEYQGEDRSCFVIEWDVDPSDMRLGDILKMNGDTAD